MASLNHSVRGLPHSAGLVAGLVAIVAALIVPTTARAQSTFIDLTEQQVDHPNRHDNDFDRRYWLSYADCVENIEITFPLTITLPGERHLEVWAGNTDCVAQINDNTAVNPDRACHQVHASSPTGSVLELALTAQHLIGGGDAGPEACDPAGTEANGKELDVYFLLIEDGNVIEGGSDKFDMGFDLVGPAAPTTLEASPGEELLVVNWTGNTGAGSDGFVIYCEPVGGSTPAPVGMQPLAGGTAGVAGGTASGGDTASGGSATGGVGTGGAGANGGTAMGGALAGAAPAAGTAGAAGAPSEPQESCAAAPTLRMGEIPTDDSPRCGDAGDGETSATADGLMNGQTYAVGVAAVDVLGNPGPLSPIQCVAPKEVTTFFENYRGAGGKAGGHGFCAFGPGHTRSALAALSLAGLVLAVRRRRRR